MIGSFDEKKAFEYENGYYLTSDTRRLGKLLAHYELYKKIIDLPGSVVELGVFKGASLIRWATFRELLENEQSRKIIGFDIFGEFPSNEGEGKLESDQVFINNWNQKFKDEILTDGDIAKSLSLKNIGNVELVKGDILETLPKYIANNGNMRISLLHIDVDVFEPTKKGLELLYDLVVPNGIIVFDDYSSVEGATRAIDNFFKDKKETIHKLPISHEIPAYVVKMK